MGILVFAICISAFGFTQIDSRTQAAAPTSSEEAVLRAVVEKYFAACGKKDLVVVVSLWSEKSPNLAAYKRSLEQQFASEDLNLGSLAISRVKVESEKASLRATIALTSIDLKSGQKRERRLSYAFEFVKEREEWKVWRFASAAEDLAGGLVKTDSKIEREELLAAEKDVVTVELGRALLTHGRQYLDQGNNTRAAEIFELAMNIAGQLGDQKLVASALLNIGIMRETQGDYAQALEQCQKSLKASEEIGDKVGIARALNIIGIVYKDQGNYVRALEEYQKSLKISEEVGDKTGIAASLNSIGNIHVSQGNYTEALEQYRKSLKIKEELGDRSTIVGTLTNIGNIYSFQGNLTQTLEYYQKSLKISEEIGRREVIAVNLNNIGLILTRQGNDTEALEQYQKSLKIREELGDKAGIARTLNNIASVHLRRNNYIQTLEIYQKGLKISEELGNKAGIAQSLLNIGDVYLLQGSYTQALERFQKSQKFFEEIGSKNGIARVLSDIGIVLRAQGNHTQALEQYQKCLKIHEETGAKESIGIVLYNIGGVYRSEGKNNQALEQYQKSLKIFEEIGAKARIAGALNGIGDIYNSEGNYTEALQVAARATDLATRTGSTDLFCVARINAGKAYFGLNQLSQARLAFDQAIAIIETLRAEVAGGEQEQQSFFEDKVSPFQAVVELLIQQNNPAEALTYAERAKARVLLEVLSSGRVDMTKVMTGEERGQERKFNDQLASLNSQIYREKSRSQPDPVRLVELEAQRQQARLDLEAFETNLYLAHPELKTRRGEAPLLRLEQAGSLMPDAGTALLEFVVAEEKTYLFVLTKSPTVGIKVYPLEIKQKDLTERIESFRQMLSTADNRFSKPAHDLYDALLKPAAAELQGKTRLVIVPDGPLWELPFQALQTPKDRYLIDDHAISYAPSLTVLREMVTARRTRKARPFASPSLLALGNPALGRETIARVKAVMMDEQLDPLPEAERQVRTLGRIYGPARSKIYVGGEAREERFKSEAKDFQVLHLATHGILNDRSPMYSYLLLAQTGEATEEDGMLEAWELMKLDLKADLAVLSACETARGHVSSGEGIIGMTWALFVAGVPTTVVSQWKVRSDSTAELMVEFHRRLKIRLGGSSGRNSAAEALRAAALKLKGDRRYQHPFHWASFVVVGDGY